MTFTEARKALNNGKKIRHQDMPDGNAFMLYQRGFATDMIICVDGNENLSADDMDFCDILASAFYDTDSWEVLS